MQYQSGQHYYRGRNFCHTDAIFAPQIYLRQTLSLQLVFCFTLFYSVIYNSVIYIWKHGHAVAAVLSRAQLYWKVTPAVLTHKNSDQMEFLRYLHTIDKLLLKIVKCDVWKTDSFRRHETLLACSECFRCHLLCIARQCGKAMKLVGIGNTVRDTAWQLVYISGYGALKRC